MKKITVKTYRNASSMYDIAVSLIPSDIKTIINECDEDGDYETADRLSDLLAICNIKRIEINKKLDELHTKLAQTEIDELITTVL